MSEIMNYYYYYYYYYYKYDINNIKLTQYIFANIVCFLVNFIILNTNFI